MTCKIKIRWDRVSGTKVFKDLGLFNNMLLFSH